MRWFEKLLEATFVQEYIVSVNLPNSLGEGTHPLLSYEDERLRDLSGVKQLL